MQCGSSGLCSAVTSFVLQASVAEGGIIKGLEVRHLGLDPGQNVTFLKTKLTTCLHCESLLHLKTTGVNVAVLHRQLECIVDCQLVVVVLVFGCFFCCSCSRHILVCCPALLLLHTLFLPSCKTAVLQLYIPVSTGRVIQSPIAKPPSG